MRPLALAFALVMSFAFFVRADTTFTPTNNLVSTMPRQELPSLLASTNIHLVNEAFARLYNEGMTYDDLAPIFKNPSAQVRLAGLDYLRRSYNSDTHAIDIMIPLLRDPDKNVRDADAMVLRSFTGQEIPEDQPGEWEKWWTEYKPYFQLMERARILRLTPQTGRNFHSRGCVNYDLKYFTNALIDFRQACELGSDVTDYSWCRLWLVQSRLGDRNIATKDLKAYLQQHSVNPDHWSAQIAHFLVGDVTEDDLLKEASFQGAEPVEGQLCEAYFYIGSKDLVDGNKTVATEYFKKCLGTHLSTYEEYCSAQAELGIPVPPPSKPSEPSNYMALRLHMSFGKFGGGLMAAVQGSHGYIFHGKDWKYPNIAETNRVDMLCSADQTRIITMVLDDGPIYESTNSGMTWQVFRTPGKYAFWLNGNETNGGFFATGIIYPGPAELEATNLSEPDWYIVTTASDGTKVVVSNQNTPVLNIKYAGSVMLISWPSSYTGFVLQQNPDLTAANWTDVTNQIGTVNGQCQVAMVSTLINDFFRLKSKSP